MSKVRNCILSWIKKSKRDMSIRTNTCNECESEYYAESSEMPGLCPDCAHYLYDYKKCEHEFKDGRCTKCYWNGKTSHYVASIKTGLDSE